MSGHIVFGNQDHARAIANRAATAYDHTKDVVISHVDHRGLTGGILYTSFTDASCVAHLAAFHRRWGSRDLLWVAFDYPFRQLSLERIFGFVDERNRQARAFDTHLGFRELARLPGAYAGGFARLVLVLEYADCRWLHIKPRRIRIGV